jgi:hypothetical protein
MLPSGLPMIPTEFQEAERIRVLRNRVGNLVAAYHLLTAKMEQVSAAKFCTYCVDDV